MLAVLILSKINACSTLGRRKLLLAVLLLAAPSSTSCLWRSALPCPALPCLQRLLLASLNGLAGLLILQGLPAEAVRAYREALATSE